ncbi:hypothetical protein OJF2_77240 [Aquisphaera giovannonii]|uniref:Uncharacterized protein n=1 Tax=Aquisphaera giovannonii TaxID=406548 RepID=A0A5B9WEV4_9BACT|nr:hypothetical protein [Aquisphaera giovannonii]QEH39112.1 hypothetical protein OJF2_77240 [Aquisphaera giovannonii]
MSDAGPPPVPEAGPAPEGELYCLGCGARNDAGAAECWLCNGRSLVKAGPGGRPPEPASPQRFSFTIAALMVLVAVVAACLGLYTAAPGLLLLVAITSAPAVALVEYRAAKRRKRGIPMSHAERFGCFLLLLVLIPVLVAVAVLSALFIYCSLGGR